MTEEVLITGRCKGCKASLSNGYVLCKVCTGDNRGMTQAEYLKHEMLKATEQYIRRPIAENCYTDLYRKHPLVGNMVREVNPEVNIISKAPRKRVHYMEK